MKLTKKMTTSTSVRRHDRRGFTLVELIVVLAILAILAAIGAGSVIGYINKSKFDRNEANAITVYQAAQTATTQMASNGSADAWVRSLIEDDEITGVVGFSDEEMASLDEPNESVSKVVSLTFNPVTDDDLDKGIVPTKESDELRRFLSGYFYDQSLFDSTITVEFVISATYGVDRPTYSIMTLSAFYSVQNDPDNNVGWDDVTRGVGTDYVSTDGLPARSTTYRFETSHVGYYNGTEESAKPQLTSVFLPISSTYELDGHIVGPTVDDDANSDGYLFNIRNGETLDVIWSVFDSDGELHDLSLTGEQNLTISFWNPNDDVSTDSTTTPIATVTIDAATLDGVSFNESASRTVYEKCDNYLITRTSCDFLVTATVNTASGEKEMEFPLTVTRVSGDGRLGCPYIAVGENSIPADYYSYCLSLDCMSVRSDDARTGDSAVDRYGSERIFGNTPLNVIATLEGNCNSVSGVNDANQPITSLRTIPRTLATRAIDDPAYLTSIRSVRFANGNQTAYVYEVKHSGATNDSDDTEDNNFSGICVTNTLFGDIEYSRSTDLGTSTTVSGTVWNNTDGRDAVISSFRHLYNIRWITTGTANYRIVRDLEWYNDGSANGAVSEVRVFISSKNDNKGDLGYSAGVISRSPVTNGDITVVSFPAIGILRQGETLSAMTRSNTGTPYSIDNLQMRAMSFTISDNGYGLICENQGTISNIYTNNLSLVLVGTKDGDPCDYPSINNVDFSADGGDAGLNRRPTGGLVGINKSTGIVGSADTTIRMSNTVVLVGEYWAANTGTITEDGTGAVIGRSETGNNSINGVIRVDGNLAVLGRDNVGGAIGYIKTNLNAKIIVDGNAPYGITSAFNLTHPVTIIGYNNAGGAIGFVDSVSFTTSCTNKFSSTSTPTTDGAFEFNGAANYDYVIDVNLPARSLISRTGNEDSADSYNAGGAIATMKNSSGTYLSIRVSNAGSIILSNDSYSTSCGGTIGRETGCTITTTYINVVNATGSRIGTLDAADSYGAACSGGAYGYIDTSSTTRTIAINATNNGTIAARGTDNSQGAGGAIGGTSSNVQAKLFIHVVNGATSNITLKDGSATAANGVGGAIGGMSNTGNANIPTGSVIYAENHGEITGTYHVGGAIGNASKNNGKIYAYNSGTITGSGDYVGGSVGLSSSEHYGTIQAVLADATITGVNFVGGAAGRLHNFQNNAIAKTIVRSGSKVAGSGSIVGGVCGDIGVQGTGTGGRVELAGDASSPTLTVDGASGDAVGGVAGIIRANVDNSISVISADQSSTNRLAVKVKGKSDVGGVIGILRSSSNIGTDTSALISNDATNKNINVNISITLHPESYVYGTGSNVGGAVGYVYTSGGSFGGRINVGSSFGATNGGAYIRGVGNVGGAVGRFGSSAPKVVSGNNSGISVDLSLVSWTVEGTGAGDGNVGGAVGFFDDNATSDTHSNSGNSNNQFPINVELGSSTVTSAGHNVGGAIGKNRLRNGIITVTMAGMISGEYRVGGGIGYNQADVTQVEVTVLSSGIVQGTGSTPHPRPNASSNYVDPSTGLTVFEVDVGGAIGCNWANVNTVTAYVSGMVSGGVVVTNPDGTRTSANPGSNVGGAIGFAYGYYREGNSDKYYKVNTTLATIQGVARVMGNDNVGGAVGLSFSNMGTINSSITGISRVVGNLRVGGAVGYASARSGIAGNTVLGGSGSGCIDSVTATISADKALQGMARIGGAIGQIGDKWSNKTGDYISAAVKYVEAYLNSAYLFEPTATGTSSNEDACIGGVIGIFVDGRVSECKLKGTGGSVDTASSGIAYPCPSISSANTVLIAANGCSIGGIVGQIGIPGYQQNVCLSKISSEGAVRLCVVSMNGANRVGGWIGSGYGAHGGIGNNNKNEWNNVSTKVTYSISNVMMVFSEGSEVGGFVGCINQTNNGTDADISKTNPRAILANITVDLRGALICGRSSVGGLFGSATDLSFLRGDVIDIKLRDHTNIGDFCDIYGNYQTEICYEAGGAIGSITKTKFNPNITVAITVYADSTSGIGANGIPGAIDSYGVGGAFGRSAANVTLNFDNRSVWDNGVVRVLPLEGTTTPVHIYSRASHVGGMMGVMINGTWTYTTDALGRYDCVNVTIDSRGSTSASGGFVGRMTNGKIYYSYVSGAVSANGAYTGGFVGFMADGTIENCYSTALVTSTGSNVGGFVGSMTKGTIKYSYVGGHTFEGRYIPGEGNITGVGNVGGFVGAVNNSGTIDTCYTTASVYGTDSNLGGFIGSASNNCNIQNSYCTGLVSSPDGAVNVGIFAGTGNSNRFTSDMAIYAINATYGGPTLLIGSSSSNPGTDKIGFMTYDYNDDHTAIICDYNDGTYAGHPFDAALSDSNYPIRAYVNNEHHGDWPLPIYEGGIPITSENVTIGHDGKFVYQPGDLDLSEYITVMVDRELVLNQDYTITYRDYRGVGIVTVVIAAKSGSNYSGIVVKTVEIKPATIVRTDLTVVLDPDSYSYTGAAIVPTATVTFGDYGNLVYNTDYYFTYRHSDPTLDGNHTDVGTITVSVCGMGNFDGVVSDCASFQITRAEITEDGVTLAGADQLVYNGEQQCPDVVVRQGGRTLEFGRDYTLTYLNNIHAGNDEASVTVSGINSYIGDVTVSFTIQRAINSWEIEPSVADWTYGQTPSTPEALATYGYDVIPGHSGINYSYAYYEDEDCKIPIEDISSVDVGSYYARFWVDVESIVQETEHDDFTEPPVRIVRFTVNPADVSEATLLLNIPEPTYEGSPEYTGLPIYPGIVVNMDGTLVENTDYEVVWPMDVTNPGEKTIIINGIGNYTGSTSGIYEIVLVRTVTFNTNGGSPAITDVRVRDGNTIEDPTPEDFGRSGYRFDGWYSDAELLTPFVFGETTVNSNLTLYAKWVVVYTIRFEANGGSSIPDQTVEAGGYIVPPENPPIRDHYTFDGWFYDPELSDPVDYSTKVYSDYTLYAAWVPDEYEISFVTNCPESVSPQTVAYPNLVVEPEISWEEHELIGWFTDEGLTNQFDFSVAPTSDAVLYAKWEEIVEP